MYGDLWLRGRALMLEQLDLDNPRTAAREWQKKLEMLQQVETGLLRLSKHLDAAGLVGAVSGPFQERIDLVRSALEDAVTGANSARAYHKVPSDDLDGLAGTLEFHQLWVRRMDAMAPQLQSGFPAERLNYEFELNRLDAWMQDRLRQVDVDVVNRANDLDAFSPAWPEGAPRADPSASAPA